MPRVSVVAKNYAKALLVAAIKHKSVDKVASDLDVFKKNFSVEFAHELENPVISKGDLIDIIAQITTKLSLSELTSNFFAALASNRRIELFSEIYDEFQHLERQQKDILEVELVVASNIEQSHINSVKELVEKKYPGKTVSIKESVKKEILGGMQIRIGSEVIDASLQNQLDTIGKECFAAIN